MRVSRLKRARDSKGGLAEANRGEAERDRRREGAQYLGEQLSWHYKPNKGGAKVHCDVCGALGMREGDRHRGLVAGEYRPRGAIYAKSIKVAFGHDWDILYFDGDGKRVHG